MKPRSFFKERLLARWCEVFLLSTMAGFAAAQDHPVIAPECAVSTFRVPEGFEIRLVAAEPALANPMTLALDEAGRIYISLAHTYRYGPQGSPVEPPSNPILRLELGPDSWAARHQVVAAGFANPVMGLAARGQKLWITNLNQVLVAELDGDGRAQDFKPIVRDADTPWNPFGMYRLAFGPDGLLYLSIGDHPIQLSGANNAVKVRGNTGAVFRLQPDGSNLELLLQGMRAPFAFDISPFGDLWVLSNGEGNPNRLIHAIPGADYHFQTRAVDWEWLAGRHPLAPPVRENPPGAHTAILVCRSAAFPEEYQGNLLVSNWGAHGFPSANHVILRHILDERGEVVKSEPFLTTTDPRFRPTQIAFAPDGGLYLLDWYGQDDENDLTGRLYKISYIGRNRTGPGALAPALAAAEELWALRRRASPEALPQIEKKFEHGDPRVRRLAAALLRELGLRSPRIAERLGDADPAVQVEAALSLEGNERLAALGRALRQGAARIPRLRYRAALELARQGREEDFQELLEDTAAEARLAGLIALDEAFHEGPRAAAARRTLASRLSRPGAVPLLDLLDLAGRWPHADFKEPILAQIEKPLPAAEFTRAIAVLRRLGVPMARDPLGAAVRRFLAAVCAGTTALAEAGEKSGALEVLPVVWPDPGALGVLEKLLREADPALRARAQEVLAALGAGDPACIEICRKLAVDGGADLEARLDALTALPKLEPQLEPRLWRELLESPSREIAEAAARLLRVRKGQPEAAALLDKTASLPEPEPAGKEALRQRVLARLPSGNKALGRLAFNLHPCHQCHLPRGGDPLLGPPLQGIASLQPPEYLVDSILYPSQVVKTGYQAEAVVTRKGEVLAGRIVADGDDLVITSGPGVQRRVPLAQVKGREEQKLSIMPEGLEQEMTEAELVDLAAYLASLR